MTELPQGSWQSIAIDFMGPLPSGDYVFAVTDYYSRYVEVSISKKNTADVAINSLEKMFAVTSMPCAAYMNHRQRPWEVSVYPPSCYIVSV